MIGITSDCIKMEDLKGGYLYKIAARNSNHGIWIPERRAFAISRFKFGDNYIFEEYHWDTGTPYGTVKPLEEIEESPFFSKVGVLYKKDNNKEMKNEDTILEYLNKFQVAEVAQW